MFRNCLAAALRHLARNKLYTAISVFGLSVGICTALLASLVIHDLLDHDHFIPGYARTYVQIHQRGTADEYYFFSANPKLTGALKLASPEIEAVTRLCIDQKEFKHGNVASDEHFFWGDPRMFDVLP